MIIGPHDRLAAEQLALEFAAERLAAEFAAERLAAEQLEAERAAEFANDTILLFQGPSSLSTSQTLNLHELAYQFFEQTPSSDDSFDSSDFLIR